MSLETPKTQGFNLDPFQTEAINAIEQGNSVLVSAPTGAGKTLIAEEAIKQAMNEGREVIYTAPVKALSNQKYRDFRATYGEEKVGIVTGDVTINSRAPILIMTTEIYRNTLFENPERFKNVSWVIFDEVHYLDDLERGTVWEESIMFTPDQIELLCLSATIPNVEQIADWIRSIHTREVKVIQESHRPVPLEHLFQCQGALYTDLHELRTQGFRGVVKQKSFQRRSRRRFPRQPMPVLKPNRLDQLVHDIRDNKRLPCIYFAFGRRQTESLAKELSSFNLTTQSEQNNILSLYDQLLNHYRLTKDHTATEMRQLVRNGIAYHHAGMLPTLKEVVEQLFTQRKLKMIFTTETFALGINMPARSVVFDELRKFYGVGFANLRTRDFYQMAGRAGRRGMDEAGFVYSRINPNYMDCSEIQRIIWGHSEAVTSQFNSSYATLLNLYKQFGEGLLKIYPRSLHHYQASEQGRRRALEMMKCKLELLRELNYLDKQGLTPKGEFASWMYGYELLMGELQTKGWLEEANGQELVMMLISLIYEPRKRERVPHYNSQIRRLSNRTAELHRAIHKKEKRLRIYPPTKAAHFNMAPGILCWMSGDSFEELSRVCFADDGEIVRYFRMAIQLLRQIQFAPHVSEKLKEKANKAVRLINRGVVDAERQLRA